MRVGRFSVPSPMPFTLSDTVNIWLTQVPSLSLMGEYICSAWPSGWMTTVRPSPSGAGTASSRIRA